MPVIRLVRGKGDPGARPKNSESRPDLPGKFGVEARAPQALGQKIQNLGRIPPGNSVFLGRGKGALGDGSKNSESWPDFRGEFVLGPQTLVLLRQNHRWRKPQNLITKQHVMLINEKPLSSSSKMHTTLAQELQNESAGHIFPFFSYLTPDDNLACIVQNLSFMEAKLWFMKNH